MLQNEMGEALVWCASLLGLAKATSDHVPCPRAIYLAYSRCSADRTPPSGLLAADSTPWSSSWRCSAARWIQTDSPCLQDGLETLGLCLKGRIEPTTASAGLLAFAATAHPLPRSA